MSLPLAIADLAPRFTRTPVPGRRTFRLFIDRSNLRVGLYDCKPNQLGKSDLADSPGEAAYTKKVAILELRSRYRPTGATPNQLAANLVNLVAKVGAGGRPDADLQVHVRSGREGAIIYLVTRTLVQRTDLRSAKKCQRRQRELSVILSVRQIVMNADSTPGRSVHRHRLTKAERRRCPVIGLLPRKVFPSRQLTGKNLLRPGGRIFTGKLSAGRDFSGERSYNGETYLSGRRYFIKGETCISIPWLPLSGQIFHGGDILMWHRSQSEPTVRGLTTATTATATFCDSTISAPGAAHMIFDARRALGQVSES